MGQANPFKPIALVVEDEVLERELMVAVLEEESTMGDIHVEAMAANGRAPRGRAFAGLTPRSRRWSVRPSRVDHAPPAEDRGGSPEKGHCGGWKRLGYP